MAEMKFGKGSKEWLMFTDYWQFVQKYYIPEPQDEWWEEFIKAGDNLIKKYGKTEYIKALVMAHVSEVERRFKSAKV